MGCAWFHRRAAPRLVPLFAGCFFFSGGTPIGPGLLRACAPSPPPPAYLGGLLTACLSCPLCVFCRPSEDFYKPQWFMTSWNACPPTWASIGQKLFPPAHFGYLRTSACACQCATPKKILAPKGPPKKKLNKSRSKQCAARRRPPSPTNTNRYRNFAKYAKAPGLGTQTKHQTQQNAI